ncbi:MAG: TlpA family protein disulfide reductase [Acidobacteriota bacterium]|nr:TlpA family protein disulfide reductase [Acidobacteriota bacterium]
MKLAVPKPKPAIEPSRKNWTDKAIVGLIAVLLLALGSVIVVSMRETVVQAGDRAPQFSVTTDKGLRITPTDFGGKVLVLVFWAAWCAPCVEEMPSLDQFSRDMADSGVVVLGVSVDRNEKLYTNLLKRFRVPFQNVRDPDANISAQYGTYKYPESYIIDRSGKVAQKIIGPQDWNDPVLRNYVKSLL